MKKIRLRYAPSPTGRLHMGGARTALFNYLYAKHMDGDFLIRIEDTDIARNIEDGERSQIENLEWMGVKADYYPGHEDEVGPYRQSERLDIYDKYIEELIEKGLAYKCWCTPEELEAEREEANKRKEAYKYSRKCLTNPEPKEGMSPSIRIKMPENVDLSWNDGVRGTITVNTNDIGDWVIRKSNGIPTYSFANVIDDHLMGISHVMRGEEHISNTPKQIHLYQVFGWEHPEYSHLTIITDMDGKKLSKRNETLEQFVEGFKNRGYLPEAVLNFMALLGWSPKSEQEIFTKEELIKLFTPEGLSKSSSKFDIEKLKWTNNQYIQKLSDSELKEFLIKFVEDKKDNFDEETLMKIFKIYQPQIRVGEEINELINLFIDGYSIADEDKQFAKENQKIIELVSDRLKSLDNWVSVDIKEIIMSTGKENEIKGKLLMMPLRLALTGKTSGPDISSVMEVFGKEKTLERMENFIND